MFLTEANKRLLQETDDSITAEREATVRVLKNFLEIDRRRLYSALGKGSLKEFVMDRYKFSEDEAWRRIKAMKLLKEVPQLEEKIESGALTLTHMGLAQSLFRHESKNHGHVFTKAEKLEVLEKMENTTTREAQKMTFALASSPLFKSEDKIRPISVNEVEFKFKGTPQLESKLEKLKGLLAHSHPNISLGDLMDKLCDLGIKAWDPAEKAAPAKAARQKIRISGQKTAAPRNFGAVKRVKIPARLQIDVWRRDRSCCRNCGATYALQIDHVKPIAAGGDNSFENLRLLCRACNQRAAIETLGLCKMQKYL